MERRNLTTLIFSILVFTSLFGQQTYQANLTGRQEVPSVLSPGSGLITATLTGSELKLSGSFMGLQSPVDTNIAGGAHIHMGIAGQNGPVSFVLSPEISMDGKSGTFVEADNTFMLDSMELMALESRGLYVNIHTIDFPSGELRGQLQPAATSYFHSNLYGSNQVPSIISGGMGSVVLDLVGDVLTVSGSFSGLESPFDPNIAGGAHIHIGFAGENGAVDLFLDANVSMDGLSGEFLASDNTFVLSTTKQELLEGRQYYINLHTEANQSGDLRGQVVGQSSSLFRGHLSGNNQVPALISQGGGVVLGEYYGDGTLVVSGSYSGMGSALAIAIAGGAHIHLGFAGENGPVELLLDSETEMGGMSGVFKPSDNTFTVSTVQAMNLYERRNYVNIHSEEFQPGELRGQLLPEGNYQFTAPLSGIFESLPVLSTANGMVKAELNANMLTLSGSFSGLGSAFNANIAGGAHLHVGLPGENGGVDFAISVELDVDGLGGKILPGENSFELTSGQLETLRARSYYVNIHTQDDPSGELRGQLLGESNVYLTALLSGSSEVPALTSGANGAVVFELVGDQLTAYGAFSGLSSMFNADIAGGAHIHQGFAGSNGGISLMLMADLEPGGLAGRFTGSENSFTLSETQSDLLLTRQMYVNIHTQDDPSGELRGQVIPSVAAALFTVNLSGMNEIQPLVSDAIGGVKGELRGNVLTLTGSFSNLSSMFNADIAGGAHIHMADPGANGGVVFLLDTEVAPGGLSGVYRAADNSFELTEAQLSALLNGEYYVNIHTQDDPSGELRGQLLGEINFFPSAPMLTMPEDGSVVTISTPNMMDLEVNWTSSMDASELAYIWQLSTDIDFTELLINENVGSDTMKVLTDTMVEDLLQMAGLMPGDSITLYHRVNASDGSLRTPSDVFEVTLVLEAQTGPFKLAGTVITENGDPVNLVNLTLSGDVMDSEVTGTDGMYMFENIPLGSDVSILAAKDINYLNGISTFDAVLIQRHILNIEMFTTPYQRIAADINDNGMIEIGDLMQLRRIILLLDNDFLDPWSGEKNNNSWRFAPPGLSTAGLSPIEVPLYEDFINIDNVNTDMLNLNFIGVKIGDINSSNMPNMITPVVGDELHSFNYRDIIRFKVDDSNLAANEVVSIDFRASDFTDVLGFQFTLAFDNNALNYQGITGAALPQMGSNNVGTRFTDKGLLTFSWNDANTLLQDDEVMFTLHFNILKNSRLSELININSDLIRNEGYRSGLEYNEVVIDWTGSFTNTSEVQSKLQLYPNPFNTTTELQLKVPFEQAVTIQLFDVYGRLISDFSNIFQPGATTISLDESNFPVSGMHYVRISSVSMNDLLELMKIE